MQEIRWDILTHPNPKLRMVSEPFDVSKITTPEFQAFAQRFAGFMIEKDGVGLAAPQIGYTKRIIAVQGKKTIGVYINPEIIKASKRFIESQEGCLSVPGIYGIVERSKGVRVRAYNLKGKLKEFNVSGFEATVFQHEIDHLNGVLFIDKVVGE